MTVEDNRIVDALGVETATGHAVLTISDHLEWDNSDNHLRMLQEKLNRYLAFIESGELVTTYPEAGGCHPRIDVVFRIEPPSGALIFLERAKATMAAAEIGLRWRTFSDAS